MVNLYTYNNIHILGIHKFFMYLEVFYVRHTKVKCMKN